MRHGIADADRVEDLDGTQRSDGSVGRRARRGLDADAVGGLVPGSADDRGHRATVEWLGGAFLRLRANPGEEQAQTWDYVFGRNDARDAYSVLYHDERGVCRVFDMTFDGTEWTMLREDPDFHQRWVSRFEGDTIVGRWEASDDQGSTWRKDFDLVFARTTR
jgi:hypothetical protein